MLFRSILDSIVENIEGVAQVDEVHIVTNARKAPAFERWAEGRGVRIHDDGTSSNDDRLGAIGDMRFVVEQAAIDDDLLVIAGDNLFEFDLPDFVAWLHRREPVFGWRFAGEWFDIGDLEQLLQADNRLRAARGLPQRAAYSPD